MWRKYLDYRKKIDNEDIENIEFRNKEKGWINYNVKFKYKNDSYLSNFSVDPYMKLFLNNVSLRKSCYECVFKGKFKRSDLTLGDFWGIDFVNPNLYNKNGVSLVIINSNKGLNLFNSISSKIYFSKVNIDSAIQYNSAIVKSVNLNKNRDKLFKKLDSETFDKLGKLCKERKSIVKRIIRKSLKVLRGKNGKSN